MAILECFVHVKIQAFYKAAMIMLSMDLAEDILEPVLLLDICHRKIAKHDLLLLKLYVF